MVATVLENLLIMSLLGSFMTLIILAIKPVTRKCFEPSWQYYVWVFVLMVMALPLSNASLLLWEVTGLSEIMTADITADAFTVGAEEIIRKLILPNTAFIDVDNTDALSVAGNTGSVKESTVITAVWLLGVILTVTCRVFAYERFRKTIVQHSVQMKQTEKFASEIGSFPRNLEIRSTMLLDAPLLIGLFNLVLYLPSSAKDEDIALILKHELVHYKRHDILYKWATMLVLSIHWFNPISGVIRKEIDEECEISCDFEATRGLDIAERTRYMALILNMISKTGSQSPALTTGMSGSGKKLKRRFEMIKERNEKAERRKWISVIVACALLLAVVFAGAVLADNANTKNNGNGETGNTPSGNAAGFEWKWPVPSSTTISSGYKIGINPATGEELSHYGVDIVADEGEDVVSAIVGKVTEADYDSDDGYYIIVTDSATGTEIKTLYAHLSEICVEVGDEVIPGDVIGKVGSTGASTGPHLHFEIAKDGEYKDPLSYYSIEYDNGYGAGKTEN